MKKLFILISILNIAQASQTIQIQAHLPVNSPDGNFLFIIDDMDIDTKTPAQMYLHAGQNLATFHVNGDHYQVIPATLQAPNMQFTPCAPTQQIDNHSLIITITGNIAPNQLQCAYRETATLPQLYTPTVAPAPTTVSVDNNTTTMPSSDPKTNSVEMGKYLTALSQQCTPGEFHMNYAGKKVDYMILGMKSATCEVSIDTNDENKPLLCHFTMNDVALMASPSRISQAQQGNAQYSANDLTARIMQQRCSSL